MSLQPRCPPGSSHLLVVDVHPWLVASSLQSLPLLSSGLLSISLCLLIRALTRVGAHPAPVWSHISSLHLQSHYFQIKSQPEVMDTPVCSQTPVAGGHRVAFESAGEIIKLLTHRSCEMIFPIPGEVNWNTPGIQSLEKYFAISRLVTSPRKTSIWAY